MEANRFDHLQSILDANENTPITKYVADEINAYKELIIKKEIESQIEIYLFRHGVKGSHTHENSMFVVITSMLLY